VTAVSPSASPEQTTLACLPHPGPPWGDTLYPAHADDLGCALAAAQQPTGVYQPFDKGLMIWRADADLVYVLYYDDGTFEVYDVRNVPTEYPNEHDLLKGAFGYLWNTHSAIREKIQNPVSNEWGTAEFTVQEFQTGTIIYFFENNANHYILLAETGTWFTE
jgi:hypothetical protein